VYIVTAWDKTSESIVRAPDGAEAVRCAREFVNHGKRVSIVRTQDGQALAFSELEEEARNAQKP
jgi:hypothetical protein